ncbi:hypothetical protein [Candidatus Coxiella mudrowiae]|uniref:hypothetical protein n=1 Tax=Candidatus Coxiella mudrowiae TaxID=2054173 RepID=UPI0012FF5304|nr:hypothetical protein [Candidatus Coxiella mudrowiae]
MRRPFSGHPFTFNNHFYLYYPGALVLAQLIRTAKSRIEIHRAFRKSEPLNFTGEYSNFPNPFLERFSTLSLKSTIALPIRFKKHPIAPPPSMVSIIP